MVVHAEYVKRTFSVLSLSTKNLLVNIKNIVKQQKNSLCSSFTSRQNRFQRKGELLNLFFAKQCSIIDNSSELPSNFLKKQTNLSL